MTLNGSKLIEILDPQAGTLRETDLSTNPAPDAPAPLFENSGGRHMSLKEAATTYTSTFPQLLRSGLRTILFDEYGGVPNTHELWIQTMRSNKQDEVWIEGSTLGKLPVVGQGQPYPAVELDIDRSVQIINEKRGGIINVTREMIMFDQTNLVMQQVQDLARAMAYTEEDDAYTVLRTAGNYIRTTADNDIGNNTATTTFNADGLDLALKTLRTMKDRKSGRLYGINPVTLIIGVGVEVAAKQLLMSDFVQRQHGNTTAETIGTGTSNPFRGQITEIIVTPFLSNQYNWVLMEKGRAVVKQVVWDLELVQNTSPNSQANFDADTLQYKVSKFYGIGMKNDRFAFYSDSTTAPTVA